MDGVLQFLSAENFMSGIAALVIKGTITVACAGLLCLCLRRSFAALRHAVWAFAFVALLALPALSFLTPKLLMPIIAVNELPAEQSDLALPMGRPSALSSEQTNVLPSPYVKVPASRPWIRRPGLSMEDSDDLKSGTYRAHIARPYPVPSLLVSLWAVGFVLLMARMFLGLRFARRIVRTSVPVAGGVTTALDQVRRELGVSRTVKALEGTADSPLAVPVTMGALRPLILLPSGASEWADERLCIVLMHEMAHIKRRDWIVQLMAAITCALYWFNPLIWLAARAMRMESERACDDLVLAQGVAAPVYAQNMLEIVRNLHTQGPLNTAVAMAHPSEISGRIKDILAQRRRGRVTARGIAYVAPIALALAAALAAAQPVARNVNARLGGSALLSDSSWKTQLEDGTPVRLTTICQYDRTTNAATYWRPDGSPANNPDQMALPGETQMQTNAIWLENENTADSRVHTFHNNPVANISIQGFIVKNGRVDAEIDRISPSKADSRLADVTVHIATGSYETLIEGSAATGAQKHLPGGETVAISKQWNQKTFTHGRVLQSTEVVITLPTRFASSLLGFQLEVIDRQGNVVVPAHSGCSDPIDDSRLHSSKVHFYFRTDELTALKATAFRFVYRPIYTVVFRNVSLYPTENAEARTDQSTPRQQAVMYSTNTSNDSRNEPAQAIQTKIIHDTDPSWNIVLPDGIPLRLTTVFDTDSSQNALRYWRPDGSHVVQRLDEKDIAAIHYLDEQRQKLFSSLQKTAGIYGHDMQSKSAEKHFIDLRGKYDSLTQKAAEINRKADLKASKQDNNFLGSKPGNPNVLFYPTVRLNGSLVSVLASAKSKGFFLSGRVTSINPSMANPNLADVAVDVCKTPAAVMFQNEFIAIPVRRSDFTKAIILKGISPQFVTKPDYETELRVTVPQQIDFSLFGNNPALVAPDGTLFMGAYEGPVVSPNKQTVQLIFHVSTDEIKKRHIQHFDFGYIPPYTVVFRNVAIRPTEATGVQLN